MVGSRVPRDRHANEAIKERKIMKKKSFYDEVEELLKKDKRFVSDKGELLRNAVFEAAQKTDAKLLQALHANSMTRKRFFTDVDGIAVFDKQQFGWVVSNRAFLPDSYTRFRNKIGLAVGDDMIASSRNVELVFPYKDCILEGGQTKEDQKRDEIFYNTTLAPDEVDRLLAPKVLTKAVRYDAQGKHNVETFDHDRENLIIKGNNLLSIASLLEQFEGRVMLIYLDPPYNTESDSFGYNDTFNHSSWLSFMKDRLLLAKRLLSPRGSIYVQLDYNEVHYFKVLMDEVFGADCFQREIIWDTQVLSGYKTMVDNWIRGHDSILFYTRQPKGFKFHKQRMAHRKEYLDRFDKVDENGRRYFDGRGQVRYLDEAIANGKPVGDVWYDIMSFQQIPTAKERVEFSTQKPEALIRRIIQAATDEGDLILDFFSGSGTTGAVAHKLGRRYIMCEQIESQLKIQIKRMSGVVRGKDPGALAVELGWKGGGSFVYCELAMSNQKFVERIEAAKKDSELEKIWNEMLATGFISCKIDPSAFSMMDEDFKALSLKDKKRILMDLLDMNQLYVNYCDIDDKTFRVSAADKAFTKSFYGDK